MPDYTFLRHKGGLTTASFEIKQFQEDAGALAYGEEILKTNSRYSYIEVMLNDQILSVINRGNLAVINDGPKGQTV